MIAFLLLFIYIVIQRWYSPTLIFTVLFSLTVIFSTYHSNGAMSSALSIALMMFTIVALSELECKKNIKNFLTVIAKINIAVLLIDDVQVLILTWIGSEDNIHTWLGLDNFAVFAILPMVGIIVLSDLLNYNKIRKLIFLFCVVTALCKFITFAVTSMIAFSFIAFYIFSKEYIRVTKNTKKIIILLNLIAVFIMLMNFSDIYYFISDITGKSTKYDYSRMIIWFNSVRAILESPMLGYGVLDVADETEIISGYVFLTGFSHTHNYILELLFRSGVVGTILYYLMIKDSIKIFYTKTSCKIIDYLKAFIIAFMILGITDSYYSLAPAYILVVLCASRDLLESEYLRTTSFRKG